MVLLCFVLLFSLIGCDFSQNSTQDNETTQDMSKQKGVLKVNYIDVGQADSILIQSPNGYNMLIDAGETKDNAVIGYLNNCGIKKLNVIVATHPHEDHISEMASVIDKFDVGEFYMPKKEHTTKTFERMIDSLSKKNVTVKEAKAGSSINFDNNVKCEIVAPCGNNYKDLNNWSAVVKISYGNNKFIFMGDAEEVSEKEIINSGVDINADVLKVGHHGSHSSSSSVFLDKVAPKYAVISAAKQNDYGHPHKETIQALNDRGIKIFGTYDYGNIVAVSDGQNIEFNTGNKIEENTLDDKSKSDSNSKDSQEFIGNKNSKKFHLPDCSSLPSEKNRVLFNSKEEALKQGYLPCGSCNP